MATKMTKNGVSTTTGLGQEQYEEYYCSFLHEVRIQYDYRHTNGKLFSCIAKTVEDARGRRDNWLLAQAPQ